MTTVQVKGRSFRLLLKSLVRSTELSRDARLLWVLIDSFGDHNGDSIYPSMKRLATHAGSSVDWVKKYVKELKEKGFLEVGKRKTSGGWCNYYRVTVPPKR